jgi:hypothetical protein
VIETARAVRFSGKVEQGRTHPLRAFVETHDGSEVQVVLKATDGRQFGVEGLANEMLGSLLAGDLGLPTPRPMFVELSSEFIAVIPDDEIRARLGAACPLAFASTDAGSQWRRWEPIDRLGPDMHGLALRVLAFDAFIGNADRSPRNSNLLKHKTAGGLLLIDHETAFSFRFKLFPPVTPWRLGNLSPIGVIGADSEHLFFTPLHRRAGLDFDALIREWTDLSDVRLAAYDACLPDAWADARPAVSQAIGHLRTVRDRIEECVVELRRVLG